MTLDQANDALEDAVMRFHNEMVRRGVKEMLPTQWARSFQDWFDPYEFEKDWKRTEEWLASHNLP